MIIFLFEQNNNKKKSTLFLLSSKRDQVKNPSSAIQRTTKPCRNSKLQVVFCTALNTTYNPQPQDHGHEKHKPGSFAWSIIKPSLFQASTAPANSSCSLGNQIASPALPASHKHEASPDFRSFKSRENQQISLTAS